MLLNHQVSRKCVILIGSHLHRILYSTKYYMFYQYSPLGREKYHLFLTYSACGTYFLSSSSLLLHLMFTYIHQRLSALASPTINPIDALNAYMDVTKNTFLKWDDMNKNRYHQQRYDDSIFVSLGTYRGWTISTRLDFIQLIFRRLVSLTLAIITDPFCPMTIKSLYSQAKHPEKIYVGKYSLRCAAKCTPLTMRCSFFIL